MKRALLGIWLLAVAIGTLMALQASMVQMHQEMCAAQERQYGVLQFSAAGGGDCIGNRR